MDPLLWEPEQRDASQVSEKTGQNLSRKLTLHGVDGVHDLEAMDRILDLTLLQQVVLTHVLQCLLFHSRVEHPVRVLQVH